MDQPTPIPGRVPVGMETTESTHEDSQSYRTDLKQFEEAGHAPASSLARTTNGHGQSTLPNLSPMSATRINPNQQLVWFERKDRDDYVCFANAGDKSQVTKKLANDWHFRTYPFQWNAYLNGTDQFAVGTPLSDLYKHNPSRVRALKEDNIKNVEQLANSDLGDDAIAAQRFLDEKPVNDLMAEVEQLKAQIAERDQTITELRNSNQTPSNQTPNNQTHKPRPKL